MLEQQRLHGLMDMWRCTILHENCWFKNPPLLQLRHNKRLHYVMVQKTRNRACDRTTCNYFLKEQPKNEWHRESTSDSRLWENVGEFQCASTGFLQPKCGNFVYWLSHWSTLLKCVHFLRFKITHLELISLISEEKRTFSHLSWFTSAQADEFKCVQNLIFKLKY